MERGIDILNAWQFAVALVGFSFGLIALRLSTKRCRWVFDEPGVSTLQKKLSSIHLRRDRLRLAAHIVHLVTASMLIYENVIPESLTGRTGLLFLGQFVALSSLWDLWDYHMLQLAESNHRGQTDN